ncbi:hypothetical protein PoB_004529600 [Plakobranchus ocellatus]|uniref:Uncharacterized protein n=1 Tax=Plakobranchus ocellatus TaxID=259542 RepID=A0AAV4B5X5_9GAST|nr:hypothetical protein PoB_004529600 [Plakobranchus ocellatus]
MANDLIMPYAKNNQDHTPSSSMLGLSVGPTLLFTFIPFYEMTLHTLSKSRLLKAVTWQMPASSTERLPPRKEMTPEGLMCRRRKHSLTHLGSIKQKKQLACTFTDPPSG